MDAKTLFNQRLPAIIQAHPDRVSSLDATFAFKISGANGGEWTLDCTSKPPAVKTGVPASADCTVESSDQDFATILREPDQAMALYFQGKIRIVGNPALSTKLISILKL